MDENKFKMNLGQRRLWEGDHNVESGLYRMKQGMAKTRTPSMPAAMTSWSPVTPTPKPLSATPCCW